MKISKITLGTAQLGMKYGISNISGKPDLNIANEILSFAFKNDINTIDTAPVYGDSEKIIGDFLQTNKVSNPVIITKLPKIEYKQNLSFDAIYSFIKKSVSYSLNNLKMDKIPIYLIHNPSDIYLSEGLVIECLDQIRKEGLINKIGISIYNPEEAEEILNYKIVDVLQAPINIFDQRLIKKGLLKKLKLKNYMIFARSIYLQGLFFLNPSKLPINLKSAMEPLIKLRKIAKNFKLDIAQLCFLFVKEITEISSVIIGMENLQQFVKNLEMLREPKSLPEDCKKIILEEFNNLPDILINPSLWKNNKGKKN